MLMTYNWVRGEKAKSLRLLFLCATLLIIIEAESSHAMYNQFKCVFTLLFRFSLLL